MKKLGRKILTGALCLTMVMSLFAGVGTTQAKAESTEEDGYSYAAEIQGINKIKDLVNSLKGYMPHCYSTGGALTKDGEGYYQSNVFALNNNSTQEDAIQTNATTDAVPDEVLRADPEMNPVKYAVSTVNQALDTVDGLKGKDLVWRIYINGNRTNIFVGIKDEDDDSTASHVLGYYENPQSNESSTHWAGGSALLNNGNSSRAELDVTGDSKFIKNKKTLHLVALTIQGVSVEKVSIEGVTIEGVTNTTEGGNLKYQYMAEGNYEVDVTILNSAGQYPSYQFTCEPDGALTFDGSEYGYNTNGEVVAHIHSNYGTIAEKEIKSEILYTLDICLNHLNTVTYNSNTATGSVDKKDTLDPNYDSYTVLGVDASVTNNGYRFIEWNTSADGKGTKYYPEDIISNIENDIELYAIWEKIPDEVIIVPGDNTGDNTGNNTGDTTITEPETPLTPGDGTIEEPVDETPVDDGITEDTAETEEETTISEEKAPLSDGIQNNETTKDAPKTGDAGSLPWLILSGISGLGFAALLITGKKKK